MPFCGFWPNTLPGLSLSRSLSLFSTCAFGWVGSYWWHPGLHRLVQGLSQWRAGSHCNARASSLRGMCGLVAHVPRISRRILDHCTSRKVPLSFFDKGASLWSGVLLMVLSYSLAQLFLIFQDDFDLAVATFHKPWLCGLRYTLVMQNGKINMFYVRYLNCSFLKHCFVSSLHTFTQRVS